MTVVINMYKKPSYYEGIMSVLCTTLQVKCNQFQLLHSKGYFTLHRKTLINGNGHFCQISVLPLLAPVAGRQLFSANMFSRHSLGQGISDKWHTLIWWSLPLIGAIGGVWISLTVDIYQKDMRRSRCSSHPFDNKLLTDFTSFYTLFLIFFFFWWKKYKN